MTTRATKNLVRCFMCGRKWISNDPQARGPANYPVLIHERLSFGRLITVIPIYHFEAGTNLMEKAASPRLHDVNQLVNHCFYSRAQHSPVRRTQLVAESCTGVKEF